jgi:hypothetical protein
LILDGRIDMKRRVTIAIAIAALMFPASLVWAKGAITRIVIDAANWPSPVEIVDPKVLDRFSIWSGPGVGGWDMINTVPKPDDAQFIIDWTRGIARDQPESSRRYLVKMYIEGREAPRDTYEVIYQIDDVSSAGYVYLPSRSTDDFGQWNTFQIYRRVEGNWFHPTGEWEGIVRPLVDER